MKTHLKNIGIFALLTFGIFSCTKPDPIKEATLQPRTENPLETIKYIDFETATNWYGILTWKSPESKGPFTYKLKVWQLKVGQDNFAAISENEPLLIKNLNNSNITINEQDFLQAEINPINSKPIDAVYTPTIIYLIESFDVNNVKVMQALLPRYSRSNKQRG